MGKDSLREIYLNLKKQLSTQRFPQVCLPQAEDVVLEQ
jgi:hypothetical protein